MDYLLGSSNIVNRDSRKISGQLIDIDGEEYYQIANVDRMPPFFTTIISDSDLWVYLSSNGGITAGRQNPEKSIFPYYTDDKIIDMASVTGHKAILKIEKGPDKFLWEPFSDEHLLIYDTKRNIYKSVSGNSILFEECNNDLGVTYKYFWFPSDKFGLIKKSVLINNSNENISVEILDGVLNILPFGVNQFMQTNLSTLVDAYKKTELEALSGLGIFSLASLPSDQAKPAESLSCNTVWSTGLPDPVYLLSTRQINNFTQEKDLVSEVESKGVKGAYLINSRFVIQPSEEFDWYFALDVAKEIPDVKWLKKFITSETDLAKAIISDFNLGTARVRDLVAKSDGIQNTSDRLSSRRHFSNTLFNIMRGGVFSDDYYIEKDDYKKHLRTFSKKYNKRNEDLLSALPDRLTYQSLLEVIKGTDDTDIIRLSYEYLPLIFSRRHGDPSRPWNKFDIQLKNPDGSASNYYEGNWRDIFQNWEALAYSYPGFLSGMISKFLNASSVDGYNPYRITRDGIEWEVQEKDDPWSYIGYWGDHQIIYLLKLLELSERFSPGDIEQFMNKEIFSFANIPYRIAPYSRIIENPKETIDFDFNQHSRIKSLVEDVGSDGKLLHNDQGNIIQVSFTQKILITALTKIYNLIPDAGIWLNTQRPEWNDANNALVGNGVSIVTLFHLRRMLNFLRDIYTISEIEKFKITLDLFELFEEIKGVLEKYKNLVSEVMPDDKRKQFMDDMGSAGSKYREKVYSSYSCKEATILKNHLLEFVELSINYCDQIIRRNIRKDGLYHSYMLIDISRHEVKVEPLQEMLEGQVAALNCGLLSLKEAEELIKNLFSGKLYRSDQQSFILYPEKTLPGFLDKNKLPESFVKDSNLLKKLSEANNTSIVKRDIDGHYHFNSEFLNVDIMMEALENLPSEYEGMVNTERADFILVYESIFKHKSFTGRSGSFFKYEGLGSIYWHMVSKLLLAIGENICNATDEDKQTDSFKNLTKYYYRVREGIGVHKSPEDYGAFPLDPYSHTPSMSGVQQPGLTGQVKEDVISRLLELGIVIEGGHIKFNPLLLRKSEFNSAQGEDEVFEYSFCNVPINYFLGEKAQIVVITSDNNEVIIPGLELEKNISEQIFSRSGKIKRLEVTHLESVLLSIP